MLKIYTITEAEKWDQVVRSFVQYDVYYLSGYVKGFCDHGDGEPLLMHYEADGLRGIQVMMRRPVVNDGQFTDLPEEPLFDLVTPYGYGGWLLEGDGLLDLLMEEYDSWCRNHNIVCEFVRFHPILRNHEGLERFYDVIPLGPTVAMDTTSLQTIWDNLTSKNRNMIRKAQKSGLRIYKANGPEIFEIFHKLYDQTMDKDHADSYYYFEDSYYQSVREDLNHNAQVFYAQTEDGEVAAAAIMLSANGRLNYHLSGSRQDLQKLAPTNLLLYEAACWACENDCASFHLGGGIGSREDGLLAFKKAFYRGELCRYHIGKRIVNSEAYDMLVSKRITPPDSSFFPAYRA